MTNIRELLAKHVLLKPVSDTARLDCELLLSHCLAHSRVALHTWPERDVPAEQEKRYNELFERRLAGEPIAYLLGTQEFWSLELEVSPATLIPRPETELLVELALECLPKQSQAQVLDLGTGTGAIALAIASERPNWNVLGVDRMEQAVDLAERNVRRLNLGNARFLCSDWFAELGDQRFDLIVSNPPYIDAQDPHLHEGDVRFEPGSALVSTNNGLGDLVKIIGETVCFLRTGGWLIVEHGMHQGEQVAKLFQQRGYQNIQSCCDLAGLDRATMGQLSGLGEG